jgi:hypothetical protein
LDIVAIGHFPPAARRRVSATAKAKRDKENQANRRGFLVHTSLGAQAEHKPCEVRAGPAFGANA